MGAPAALSLVVAWTALEPPATLVVLSDRLATRLAGPVAVVRRRGPDAPGSRLAPSAPSCRAKLQGPGALPSRRGCGKTSRANRDQSHPRGEGPAGVGCGGRRPPRAARTVTGASARPSPTTPPAVSGGDGAEAGDAGERRRARTTTSRPSVSAGTRAVTLAGLDPASFSPAPLRHASEALIYESLPRRVPSFSG